MTSLPQRRGVMLTIVVMVMTIVAGVFAVLGANLTHQHRQRQADRVRLVSRAIAASAANYARSQWPAWSMTPPAAPMELDVAALVPPKMTGAATIEVVAKEGRSVCRVAARAEWGPYSSIQEFDLPMPASQPAG